MKKAKLKFFFGNFLQDIELVKAYSDFRNYFIDFKIGSKIKYELTNSYNLLFELNLRKSKTNTL